MAVPQVQDAFKVSPMHYDNFLMDRDSANIKADREWDDTLPWAYHHRDKDYCHMLFTVAGAMQDTFSGMTSGVLALAMSTASGANWDLFKQTLLDVVIASTKIIDGLPPGDTHPWCVHRDVVLDAICSPENAIQKEKFRDLVRCDITLEGIILVLPGGSRDPERFITSWAKEFVEALVPARLQQLRRQRWLTGLKPIQQLALIAEFFNLLQRMLPHFIGRLAGKPARPISVSEDIWNPDTDDEGEYGMADVILMPRTETGEPDWAAWNKAQRRGVDRFRQSSPTGALIVTRLAAEPITGLARYLLAIHAPDFELKQNIAYIEDTMEGRYTMTVGMELLKGTGFDAFKKQITKALTDSTFWEPLPLKLRTHKHKALGFGILSRCWCGVEQSIIDDTQRMPNLIEKLLLDPESAHDIMAVPPCRQTKASVKFLKHWNSIAKLKSRRCRGQLWAKSYLQRRCSIELESKMASIRSLTRQRQQCVKKSFVVLNAEWFIGSLRRFGQCATARRQSREE